MKIPTYKKKKNRDGPSRQNASKNASAPSPLRLLQILRYNSTTCGKQCRMYVLRISTAKGGRHSIIQYTASTSKYFASTNYLKKLSARKSTRQPHQ